MIALKNILVATDFSEASDAALRYGREFASRFGATLHVLHVAENVAIPSIGADGFAAMAPELQEDIEEAARVRLAAALGDHGGSGPVTRPVVMTASSPALLIVDYAKRNDIDVIVMGTHGRGGLERVLMGSVAERVVRQAPCPVLTVRHPARESVGPLVARARAGAAVPGRAGFLEGQVIL
jgi:nucleotide-binding universal stress UspA family protein